MGAAKFKHVSLSYIWGVVFMNGRLSVRIKMNFYSFQLEDNFS